MSVNPEPGSSRRPVTLTVNGEQHTIYVEPRRTLLDALREDLGLTGAKKVCDLGQCGACTVIKGERAVYSCLTLAVECAGQPIQTIEGLALADPEQGNQLRLHAIQQAFIECDAYQCGYCTPGQIMAIKALLELNPTPTLDEVKLGVSGNLCRCGAYPNIFRAALRAAELLRTEAATANGLGAMGGQPTDCSTDKRTNGRGGAAKSRSQRANPRLQMPNG